MALTTASRLLGTLYRLFLNTDHEVPTIDLPEEAMQTLGLAREHLYAHDKAPPCSSTTTKMNNSHWGSAPGPYILAACHTRKAFPRAMENPQPENPPANLAETALPRRFREEYYHYMETDSICSNCYRSIVQPHRATLSLKSSSHLCKP